MMLTGASFMLLDFIELLAKASTLDQLRVVVEITPLTYSVAWAGESREDWQDRVLSTSCLHHLGS